MCDIDAKTCERLFLAINKDNLHSVSRDNIKYAWHMACQVGLLRIIFSVLREEIINADEPVHFTLKSPNYPPIIFDLKQAYLASYKLYCNEILMKSAIIMTKNEHEIRLEHPADLINILKDFFIKKFPKTENKYWEKVIFNINLIVENETLAICDKQNWEKVMVDTANTHSNLWYFLITSATINHYDFFNKYSAYCGNQTAINAKMKSPLSLDNVFKYSPEFGRVIPIALTALSKTCVDVYTSDSNDTIHTYFHRLSPEAYKAWNKKLRLMNKEPKDYIPFPIHPLNIEAAKDTLNDLLISEQFILMENITLDTKASLSFRTMLPTHNNLFVIKLSIPIQTTNIFRDIAIKELYYGVNFCNAMSAIILNDEMLFNHMILEKNLVGVCLRHKNTRHTDRVSRSFSYVLRAHPQSFFKADVITMPLASIFIISPFTKKPLYIEMMQNQGITDHQQAIVYFMKYIKKVLMGPMTLFLSYGIVIESHQQNSNLAYDKQGQICTVLYHDLMDAVIIHSLFKGNGVDKSLFYKCGLSLMDHSIKKAIRKFTHVNLWMHLYPLAYLLANEYNVHERVFIEAINQSVLTLISTIKTRSHNSCPDYSNVIDKIQFELLDAKKVAIKPMLINMYLQSQSMHWAGLSGLAANEVDGSKKLYYVNRP